ncbi:MAG: hypothetical protein AB1635_02010 [Acidobacteriota bacterium]
MQRFLTDREVPSPRASFPITAACPIAEFYRQEFIRLHRCLQAHRDAFTPQAVNSVEAALVRVIAEIDKLSRAEGADLVVARLLKEFGVVARLAGWSDGHPVH